MTEAEELELLQLRKRRLEAFAEPAQPPAMEHVESSSQIPPRQPSSLAGFGQGAMKGLQDMGFGAQQRWAEITGSPQAAAMQQQVADQRAAAEQEALLKGPPSLAFGAGEMVGKAAPLAAASMIPGGQTLTGAAVLGGVGGALEPSANAAETFRNTGLGAGSSWLTSLGVRAFAPRTRIEPEVRMMNKAAEREGVPLMGGQKTDLDYVKRAEAHGLWNPLTRWHARGRAEQQADYFIRSLMKRAGLKESEIPPNPSMNPGLMKLAAKTVGDELDYNFVGKFYTPKDFGAAFREAQKLSLFAAGDPAEQELVRNMAARVLQFRSPSVGQATNVRYRGEIVQELLQDLKQTTDKLYTAKSNRGGDKVRELYNVMVQGLKNPDQYLKATETWAQLKTAEELLRGSAHMGRGIPDPTKLGKVVERNMPGGVIYDNSPLADLARAGEATKGAGALPERVTGVPRLTDILNAATYFRFNNPAASAGFAHPRYRDIAEAMVRYLPFNAGMSEPVTEETRRIRRLIEGEQ